MQYEMKFNKNVTFLFNMPQIGARASNYDPDGVPSAWKYYTFPKNYTIEQVFALIGQKVIIVNNTNLNVQICTDSCSWIEPTQMAIYECEAKIFSDEEMNGYTHWIVNWTTKKLEVPDLTTEHPYYK